MITEGVELFFGVMCCMSVWPYRINSAQGPMGARGCQLHYKVGCVAGGLPSQGARDVERFHACFVNCISHLSCPAAPHIWERSGLQALNERQI